MFDTVKVAQEIVLAFSLKEVLREPSMVGYTWYLPWAILSSDFRYEKTNHNASALEAAWIFLILLHNFVYLAYLQ